MLTPNPTASLTKATCSGVFVSRFVPSPIRVMSVSPSLSMGPSSQSVGEQRNSQTLVAPEQDPSRDRR